MLSLFGFYAGAEDVQHNAEDRQDRADEERRLVASEGAGQCVHDHGAEQAGQGKADEHNTVVEAVVPGAEATGGEARVDPHNAAEGEPDEGNGQVELHRAAGRAEVQQDAGGNGEDEQHADDVENAEAVRQRPRNEAPQHVEERQERDNDCRAFRGKRHHLLRNGACLGNDHHAGKRAAREHGHHDVETLLPQHFAVRVLPLFGAGCRRFGCRLRMRNHDERCRTQDYASSYPEDLEYGGHRVLAQQCGGKDGSYYGAKAVKCGDHAAGKAAAVREELHNVGQGRAVHHAVAEADAEPVGQHEKPDGFHEPGAYHAEGKEKAAGQEDVPRAGLVIEVAAENHGNGSRNVGNGKDNGQVADRAAGKAGQVLGHGVGKHAPGVQRADAQHHEAAGRQQNPALLFQGHGTLSFGSKYVNIYIFAL